MTRDDIIRMGQEAGWEMSAGWDDADGFLRRLERFATIVAAEKEKEIQQLRRVWLITNNELNGYAPAPHANWPEFFCDMIDKRVMSGLRISAITPREVESNSHWFGEKVDKPKEGKA